MTGNTRAYRTSSRRKKENDKLSRGEIRLIASVIIFTVAALGKIFLPEFTDRIADKAMAIMSDNMDYRGAISAISDGISGKSGVKDTAIEVLRCITANDMAVQVESKEVTEPDDKASKPEDIAKTSLELQREKDEEVSAFIESKKAFSSYELPDNTTYQMPDIPVDHTLPADGKVTSDFGYRIHPVSGDVKFHYGTDIGCSEGTPLGAFADGEVTSVSDSSSYGKNVLITHSDGITTRYAHCSEITVKVGDKVKMGETVAKSGSTGNATGPCLHFELTIGGVYVNPGYYI